jgi:membrane protease YdiL (CAAX protease family)
LGSFTESGLIATTWTQSVGFILIAMVGVGWLARRSFRSTLQRLGVVGLTWRQTAIGLAAGLALVLISLLVTFIAELLGLTLVDEGLRQLNEQIIGLLQQSLPGILTIGLAAALGEELVFRGALQPRLGILLTSLVFALFHANYGISVATGVIWLLGLVLGVLRQRYNTTTAILTHAAYNILISLPVLLFPDST